MKKCSYCGKEYPDDVIVCPVDQHPLVGEGQVAVPAAATDPSAPATRTVKPATMTQLRSMHLYLGCIFAPMLLFFTISGIWQTLGVKPTKWMEVLSSLHTTHKMKNGYGSNGFWKILVLMMALAFLTTTILGILMAVKYGKNRRVAFYCLAAGVVVPGLLVVFQLMSG